MTIASTIPPISRIAIWPIDVPLTDPFVVATGSRVVAENVFVQLTLADGTRGYGEAAPLPEVGTEDRASCLRSLTALSRLILHHRGMELRRMADSLNEAAPAQPAARCALETAVLDALCRLQGRPLWAWWGGADVRARDTDMTIPIASLDETVRLARAWYAAGFRLLKMKIGMDVDDDIRRIEAVHQACPDAAFIGDGNQGFSVDECLTFVRGVRRIGTTLLLLEQPVLRADLEGLAAIRRQTGVPVAADESVRSLDDARRVLEAKAADYINIKIMKTGLFHAADIAAFALRSGLKLMVGGMVETRIAMGCSFGLVLGMAGFEVLDLDTPLLLARDPVEGGYQYDGPRLLPWHEPGLGLAAGVPSDAIVMD